MRNPSPAVLAMGFVDLNPSYGSYGFVPVNHMIASEH
jgi:hypothetical protein